jgi:acyl-CoA thioester hydrolase
VTSQLKDCLQAQKLLIEIIPLKPLPLNRDFFKAFRPIQTRWMDNDCYGHVNNVVYYSWFDTAVNTHLIEQSVLDPISGSIIGFVVSSQCNYFAPIVYPQTVEAAIAVTKIGKASVEYTIGIFSQNESKSAAWGKLVHVYVDKITNKPAPGLPLELRNTLDLIHATN